MKNRDILLLLGTIVLLIGGLFWVINPAGSDSVQDNEPLQTDDLSVTWEDKIGDSYHYYIDSAILTKNNVSVAGTTHGEETDDCFLIHDNLDTFSFEQFHLLNISGDCNLEVMNTRDSKTYVGILDVQDEDLAVKFYRNGSIKNRYPLSLEADPLAISEANSGEVSVLLNDRRSNNLGVLQINSRGTSTQWVDIPVSNISNINEATPTSDGFVIGGSQNVQQSNIDAGWAVSVDTSGKVRWAQTYNRTSINHVTSQYNQTVLLGTRSNVIVISKLNPDGSIAWQVEEAISGASISSAAITPDGQVSVVGENTDEERWKLTIDGNGTILDKETDSGDVPQYIASHNGENILAVWNRGISIPFGTFENVSRINSSRTHSSLARPSSEKITQNIGLSNGGFVSTGSTEYFSSGYDSDAWLIKFNKYRKGEWIRTYGSDVETEANDVTQTSEGGFLLVGEQNNSGWIARTDSEGSVMWTKNSNVTEWYGVLNKTDSGFVLYGSGSSDTGRLDTPVVVKIKPSGKTAWKYTAQSNEQRLQSGAATEDGYVLAGSTPQIGEDTDDDGWVLHLDDNGTRRWDRQFGGEKDNEITDIKYTDESIIVTGSTGFQEGSPWLMNLQPNGVVRWNTSVQTLGDSWVNPVSTIPTRNGYIVIGESEVDGEVLDATWVTIVTNKGDTQSSMWLTGLGSSPTDTIDISDMGRSQYLVTGEQYYSNLYESDAWLQIIETSNPPSDPSSESVSDIDINIGPFIIRIPFSPSTVRIVSFIAAIFSIPASIITLHRFAHSEWLS